MSWESNGHRREVNGTCLELAEAGASVKLNESVPLSTRVYLKFPDLHAESTGVVRHASEACIGVEFGEVMYYGPRRKRRAIAPLRNLENYLMAALGCALLAVVLNSLPGALPEWVPFAVRMDRPVPHALGFLTLGSTKHEVYAAQGPPTQATDTTWHYGPSRIFFRGDRVVGWAGFSTAPLHTRAENRGKTKSGQDHLTVGSTAANVLAIQGPPDELTDEIWRYGTSEVYFKHGKVTGWKSTAERPLRADAPKPLPKPRPSAG